MLTEKPCGALAWQLGWALTWARRQVTDGAVLNHTQGPHGDWANGCTLTPQSQDKYSSLLDLQPS